MAKIEKKVLFSETSYDESYDNHYNKKVNNRYKKEITFCHYCEDGFSLYSFPKDKPIDKPINELRRDYYFQTVQEWHSEMTTKELIDDFVPMKGRMAELNKKVMAYFHNNKSTKLRIFIETFDCAKIAKNNPLFNKIITDAKFLSFDNNCKWFIAKGLGENYCFFYYGS